MHRLPCDARSGGPRRATHCAHCIRCVQTSATSQLTIRAAREAASPALLGAPEARCRWPLAPWQLGFGRFAYCHLFGKKRSRAAGAGCRKRIPGWREAQRCARRAQRVSSSCWPRLSERRERSEHSELRGPGAARASQQRRRPAPTTPDALPAANPGRAADLSTRRTSTPFAVEFQPAQFK